MKFASKTPRDLSHDPEPWVGNPGERYSESEEWPCLLDYDPRPEFDHVQHNPPNYLLVEFREFVGIPKAWLEAISRPGFIAETEEAYGVLIGQEQIEHARRVLSRLDKMEARK